MAGVKMTKLGKWSIATGLIVGIPMLLVGFQNCSQFTASATAAKLSASCSAKIQESANELMKGFLSASATSKVPPAQLVDCESAANYSCSIRKFAAGLKDEKTDSSYCISAESCVPVTALSFSTDAARNPDNAKDFEPGGDYNHTEAQCSHSLRFRDVPLFVGLGDDLPTALKTAKSLCLAAQGRTR